MTDKNRRKSIDKTEAGVEDLSPLNFIKTEANLAGLPFFALSRQDTGEKKEIIYAMKVERDGRKLDILWKVSPNVTYGCPGPFDRKVHKAIEYIINEWGMPIENPIPFSIYQIIKILRLNSSGRMRQRVKQSLLRIFSTSVTSEGTFYSKTKEQYISDNFHIYDRVVFKEQNLPNGEVADTNYLFLNQWYLDSINAFYVRPIDFSYLQQLQSDIAGRLYELLSLKFYGVILNRRSYWKVEYKELCSLLPITAQKYLSLAKRSITPAHEELIKTQFLSKVVWNTKDKNHWYILYYPGKKAREETKPRVTQGELQLQLPEEKSIPPNEVNSESKVINTGERFSTDQGNLSPTLPDLTIETQELFSLLRDRRISEKSALDIVRKYPYRIREKIEIFDWLVGTKSSLIKKNPAGYLRRSIEEDWQPPPGFVSKGERERKAREKEKASLLKELEIITMEEDDPSELLEIQKDDISSEKIKDDIAQIKAEREKVKMEEEAKIKEALCSMTQEDLRTLKKETLAKVDNFHKSQSNYREISRKDIRNLGDESLTETYIREIRDRIIKERYLRDKS